MKENKNVFLQIRMTATEKEQLKDYAAEHNLTITELVRMALNQVMYGGKE